MKKYRVIITEEYSDIWDIGADSSDDAKKLAHKLTRELNHDKGRNPDEIRIYSVRKVSDELSEDCYTEVPERDDQGVRHW